MPPKAVPPPKSVPSAKKARPSSVGEVELSEPEGPGEGDAASKDDTSGQEHLVEGEDAIEPAEGKVEAPFTHAPLGEESLRSATPKVWQGFFNEILGPWSLKKCIFEITSCTAKRNDSKSRHLPLQDFQIQALIPF